MNRARKAYFNFIQTQKKKMARAKHTAKKRTVREDCRPVHTGKVPKKKPIKGKRSMPSGAVRGGKHKS